MAHKHSRWWIFNQGPPDLDEVWRQFLRRLKGGKPGAGAPPPRPGKGIPLIPLPTPERMVLVGVAVVLVIWLLSGFYIVDAGRVGVILRFGKFQELTDPGPHWHLPYPVEAQAVGSPLNVAQVRTVELGYRNTLKSKVLHESLMLTDDENIIDNQYAIQYTIKDPKDFLFNNRNPDGAVVQAAETAIREVVGRSKMDYVLYEGRSQIAAESEKLMQQILDRYHTGIAISKVNMQNAQPPEPVQAAFDDAVKAGQDRDRQNNEGQAYANDVIPRARGAASRLNEEAKAYAQRVVAQAEGDASRFNQVLVQYLKAPEVTRQRLYQDMMQQVLTNTSKVVADQKSGTGLLYLPLDKLIQASALANLAGSDSTANAVSPAGGGTSASPQETPPESDLRGRDALRTREREVRP
ncbi:FtsH protease activity modulator HflK [Ferrovum sp.]|uniref:FtsH protease activity modulator HflK n=1 Tax=Ferrovum sp. TaxID=2609467 RepID=UPI0026328897|nr:FtsH protease activity modulator HflK [Ferrovum sp.]